MAIRHRLAVASDITHLAALLDAEFIFGKGRTLSLAQRFPSTLCAANAQHIFIAEEDGKIVSAFLARAFDWQQRVASWRGAMIGAVFSDPQRRGEGIAGNLLAWGTQMLRDGGAEFAVLWTGRPEFYARFGWIAVDVGLLGRNAAQIEAPAQNMPPVPDPIAAIPLSMREQGRIGAIRARYLDAYAVRQSLDYHQIPIPAESVDVLYWTKNEETLAYALLGGAGESGILYEMVGNEDGFADLWQAALLRHRSITVNDCIDSPSQHWLAAHAGLAWEAKQLAMWLPLSPKLSLAQLSQWYIPYFDRI